MDFVHHRRLLRVNLWLLFRAIWAEMHLGLEGSSVTDKSEWQGRVGETWAAEWRRTDRSFGQLTERLLARTREFTFDTVLDVGCGAGELSLAIARGRPDVSVTGVDVSPSLVATAQDRGSHMANLAFTCTDAAQWQAGPDQAPDLLVSRHGVMFFDNPPAAFENLARQAQPQAFRQMGQGMRGQFDAMAEAAEARNGEAVDAALTAALRVVLDRPHDDWTQLVKAAGFTCARRILLQAGDTVALDELAAELNEMRSLDPAVLR